MLQKASSDSFREAAKRKMSITSSAATMRVLSVLRHWVTKHGQVALSEIMDNLLRTMCYVVLWQDFDGNHHLKNLTIEFLEDILCTRTLLPAEHKAASQLLRSRAGLSVMKIALINDIKCIFGLNIFFLEC